MANQQQYRADGVEILRGNGVEIMLKQERLGIQYSFRGAGATSQYDFWRGSREDLLSYLLAGSNLAVRNGRIVEQ